MHGKLPNDWQRVTPNENHQIQIRVFDDGNERYKQYKNSWIYLVNGREKSPYLMRLMKM